MWHATSSLCTYVKKKKRKRKPFWSAAEQYCDFIVLWLCLFPYVMPTESLQRDIFNQRKRASVLSSNCTLLYIKVQAEAAVDTVLLLLTLCFTSVLCLL